MKRFLLICIVALLALVLASPAMAGLKLTSKGRMDVTGIWVSNNVVDIPGIRGGDHHSTNAWYQMELVIDPTLHINEKVKIHGRITLMERYWGGVATVHEPSAGLMEIFHNYRGEHNIWVERLWLSFPLLGGELRVGRMPGGSWAYPFQNWDANRDRILYLRRFGHIVVLGMIEKLVEYSYPTPFGNPAGHWGWLGYGVPTRVSVLTPYGGAQTTPGVGSVYEDGHQDTDGYAIGAIIPFSRNIVWRPLYYYVDRELSLGGAGARSSGYDMIIANALMIKAGIFSFDGEVNYRWTSRKEAFLGPDGHYKDWDSSQWSAWAEVGVHPGPFSFVLGGFYLEGSDANFPWDNKSHWGVGAEFQPLLILFSEDIGILHCDESVAHAVPAIQTNAGVPNGSFGRSGYEALYIRGSYKINDTMSVRAIFGVLWAEEMMNGTHYNGGRASKFLGAEVDAGFEWAFMDNIKYVFEAGYFWPGEYWDDAFGIVADHDISNDVFAMRHMLVINW